MPGRTVVLTHSLNILLGILAALYPVCVYFGLKYIDARYLAVILVFIFGLRFFIAKKLSSANSQQLKILLFAIIVFGIIVALTNNVVNLKFYPVIINGVLLFVFFSSLYAEENIIYTLGKLTDPSLGKHAIPYTRKVTVVWCIFFIVNGAIAAYTSLYSSLEIWTLYNGLIAYIIMGCIFVIEFVIRQMVKHKHGLDDNTGGEKNNGAT